MKWFAAGLLMLLLAPAGVVQAETSGYVDAQRHTESEACLEAKVKARSAMNRNLHEESEKLRAQGQSAGGAFDHAKVDEECTCSEQPGYHGQNCRAYWSLE